MLRISVTRLISEEASFHAEVRSFFTSKPVKVGRKAEPKRARGDEREERLTDTVCGEERIQFT